MKPSETAEYGTFGQEREDYQAVFLEVNWRDGRNLFIRLYLFVFPPYIQLSVSLTPGAKECTSLSHVRPLDRLTTLGTLLAVAQINLEIIHCSDFTKIFHFG